MDSAKEWLQKLLGAKFDDQDEFQILYQSAPLNLSKSLEAQGICENDEIVLMHMRKQPNL